MEHEEPRALRRARPGFLLVAGEFSFDAAARASIADPTVPFFAGASPEADARIDAFLATRDALSTIGGATLAIGLVLLVGVAIVRHDPDPRRALVAALVAGVAILVLGLLADLAGLRLGGFGEAAISLAIPLAVAFSSR